MPRAFTRPDAEHARPWTIRANGWPRHARGQGHEIIFTSGGTEACNLAILGLARAHAPRGRHIITSAVEHHAVLHARESLKHHEGFDLTILPSTALAVSIPRAGFGLAPGYRAGLDHARQQRDRHHSTD